MLRERLVEHCVRGRLGENCAEREIGGTFYLKRDWGNTVMRERNWGKMC